MVTKEQKEQIIAEYGRTAGDYYVDKDTGKVYLYTEDNKITEY